MSIIFSERAYFQTTLFNSVSQSYLSTVFSSLAKEFALVSAKGSSGKWFKENQLSETVIGQTDMPYHIHILNGIFPALKLLEQQLQQRNLIEREETESFLKTLFIGFTFHDANKLINKELRNAINDDIEWLCEKVNVKSFFPKWREWLNEIKFLALRTENRTTAYSYEHSIREWQFVNETLGEVCHLADTFASLTEFGDVSDFYERLCKAKFNNKLIIEIWPLSFIEINDNLFTLLSQKLLNKAKEYIQQVRKEEILFHLHTGFVFIGKPLEEKEREKIIEQFCGDDSTFDAVAQTQINSRRGCQFGFIESRKLTPAILDEIIEAGFKGSKQIQFFEILKDANTPNTAGFQILIRLLDSYGFPFKAILTDKNKGKKSEEQKYKFVLERNSWDEFDDKQKNLLSYFALQRIKFIKKEDAIQWKREFDKLQTEGIQILNGNFSLQSSAQILEIFNNAYSIYTVAAMISVCEAEKKEENLQEKCRILKEEISTVLSSITQLRGNDELRQFAKLYLTGNFLPNIEVLFAEQIEIPEKIEMCLFTARRASEGYSSAKAHGIKALGFSNRTINTLKNDENRISSLFNYEIEMRKGFINDKVGFNSCIYYDFGEYIINYDTRKLLDTLAQAKEFQHDGQHFQVIIDKKGFNYNLYGMNFEKISENVEGNFYYIQRNLKLVKATGFRIFTTSIISPYHSHKEIFVFENCMPFVKALGWDRIRIDEVEDRLQELNLFLTLGSNKLTGNVLSFAEDRRAIFSAFQELKEDDKVKARNSFTKFINNHKELSMSTMKNLAEMAIQMARPQSGSSSQETKIIRNALDILKVCNKEKRNRETTIGHIVGELRQIAKTYDYFNDSLALPFAESIYDNLFENEWGKCFPQPNRLRNWINEFGFWYSTFSKPDFEKIRMSAVGKAVDALKERKETIDEDSTIKWLKNSEYNKNKAIDNYENDYREAFRKFLQQNNIGE